MAEALLQTYVEEGILVHTVSSWSRQALDHTITNGPHLPECSPEMIVFICRYMQWIVQDGFSIPLPMMDVVWMFG